MNSRYILHLTSGPFLKYSKAHYDIAFSCVLYLNTACIFYDPSFSEDDLKLRVLKGFHGLHHYANEFWFPHLLQYAKTNEDVANGEKMEDALANLLEVWKGDPGIAHRVLKLDDTTTQEGIEREIEALDVEGNAIDMGRDILILRAFLAQEKYAHQEADGMHYLILHDTSED